MWNKGNNIGNNREKDNSGRTILLVISILFFVIFAGSTLLHASQDKDLLHDSVETLTGELSELLTENYLMESRKQEDLAGWEIPKAILPQDCAEWVIDQEGIILQQSKDAGEIPQDVMGKLSLAELKDKQGQIIWSGDANPVLLTQDCFLVSPLADTGMYLLVKNQAKSIKATQRRQFVLAICVNLVLFILTIVIIYNVIARYRRKLMEMATTDELTRLSNRKFFNQQYEEYIKDSQRPSSSLFLLDVDHFKDINDTLGHSAGDKALSGLALQIQEMVLETGGFAGRWGGDEFIGVLFLPLDQACEKLDLLCRRVVQSEEERGFPMSVSVGVTSVTGKSDLAKVTEKADEALYLSKENGRNQISVFEAEDRSKESKLEVSETLTIDFLSSPDSGADAIIQRDIKKEESLSPEAAEEDKDRWKGLNQRNFRKKLAASIVLGVRWMTPFVAGGGILIALAFLFDAAAVDITSLPLDERANFGTITPVAAALKTLGGMTFNFMLPIFAGFMAYGLAGENAFMAGFVGGFMTIECNTGFAGAMVVGLVAGLITNQLNTFSRHLPGLVRKIAPIVIFPILNLLVLQTLTTYVISPIAGGIGTFFTGLLNRAIDFNPALGGGLAAMMLSTDMGGVINKVAYQYGLDAIVANQTHIMAAVMIGGMVPPVGIALSMLMFPHKYTTIERNNAPVTMVMGLSFITEGALPYVFTDFIRVIPSCMAGGLVAGILSVLYGCKLPAPHGGIFVIPVIEHPLMYILALTAGSLVTALLLGFLKKEKK